VLSRQLCNWICRPAISIEEKDVDLGDQLGSGGFSVVYRGTWLGTPVAIKQWFDSNASSEKRLEIREEILTLAVKPQCTVSFLSGSVVLYVSRHTSCIIAARQVSYIQVEFKK
jgi:predicted Ser/Thr protein kinase